MTSARAAGPTSDLATSSAAQIHTPSRSQSDWNIEAIQKQIEAAWPVERACIYAFYGPEGSKAPPPLVNLREFLKTIHVEGKETVLPKNKSTRLNWTIEEIVKEVYSLGRGMLSTLLTLLQAAKSYSIAPSTHNQAPAKIQSTGGPGLD